MKMLVSVYDMFVSEKKIPYLEEVRTTRCTDDASVANPSDLVDIMENAFKASRVAEEHVWMIGLDSQLHCIAVFDVSHGTVNRSAISCAGVLQRALLSGSSCIMLAHVHPSGNTDPSEDDIEFTTDIEKACDFCGIRFIDHVIISGSRRGRYYSFRESELLHKMC